MTPSASSTRDEVLATARKLRAQDIPADVILLDGQAWQDNRTRFRFAFDPARYPDPRAVLDELHALNFKVCVWEYPMVSVRGPLFTDFEAKGWLLRDPATGRAVVHDWGEASKDPLSPLQPSGLIDFTHPDAYAYWQEGHAKLFELGVDVIKTDFGEQVPQSCVAQALELTYALDRFPVFAREGAEIQYGPLIQHTSEES